MLHLEVFTYDDIEVFRNKAKEAYQQDKKQDKEKRSLPDNFLYVDRNQPYYSLVGKEPTQIGETQTEIFVPLSELEKKSVKVKDDQGKEISKDYYNIQPYLHQSTTNSNVGIYVDDSHLTQDIIFPGMNVFTTQSNGVDIFDQTLCHYLNPDEEDLESKERLNPLFKAIMEELDLDKEKGEPVRFEAGRLHQLSLDAIQHRRFIGIIPKHQSEWASNRVQQFEALCNVFTEQNDNQTAQRIRKRVGDLSIQLKVRSFDTDKEAYFIHPLGLIGWLEKENICLCNKDIPLEIFTKIPIHHKTVASKYLDDLNVAFKNAGITTCLEKAYFLANSLHESAEYTILEEYLGSKREEDVYDGYKGRGFFQLTWEANYRAYGASLGNADQFLGKNKVRIATEKEHTINSAIWFWKNKGLAKLANDNDLIGISAILNAGYNGFDERAKYFKRAVLAFNLKNCQSINEKIKQTLDNYIPFMESYASTSNRIGECFGWGLWHDPATSKKGTTKDIEKAKEGYSKFLELAREKQYPFGTKKRKDGSLVEIKRYSYTGTQAVSFAQKRLSEL